MSQWFLTAITERACPRKLTVVLETDVPCHLWCRHTLVVPRRHLLARDFRGLRVFDDPYFCFDAYTDLEQTEAGDTLEHTFILTDFLENTTRYFYFHGQIAGANSPSTSCILARKMQADELSFSNSVQHAGDEANRHGGVYRSSPSAPAVIFTVGRWMSAAMKEGGAFRIFLPHVFNCAEILDANLIMTSYDTSGQPGVKSRFNVEDYDNCPDWYNSTWANMVSRYSLRWGAVEWDDIPPWTAGLNYVSPDVSVLVQHVVNRPGWKAGNAIGIFWTDFEQRTAWDARFYRWSRAYGSYPAESPKLVMKYRNWYVKGIPLW